MKKLISKVLLLMLFPFFISSCGNNSNPEPEKKVYVTDILFELSQNPISQGNSCIITNLKVYPYTATNQEINFYSTNENIATIDGYSVKGVAVGTTTIVGVAKDGSGTKKEIELKVTEKKDIKNYVESINLSSSSSSLKVGEKAALYTTVLPENADNKSVTYEVTPSGKAEISGNVLLAISTGDINIKAYANDGSGVVSNSIALTIKDVEVPQIVVEPEKTSLVIGETVSLYARVLPVDAPDKQLSYKTKSGKDDIISVNNAGKVTANNLGEDTVVVYMTNNPAIQTEVKFTVKPIEPEKVVYSVDKTKLYVDDKVTISAKVMPNNAVSKEVTFRTESGKSDIISVNENGEVTAISPGNDAVIVSVVDYPDVFTKVSFKVAEGTDPKNPYADDEYEGV